MQKILIFSITTACKKRCNSLEADATTNRLKTRLDYCFLR
jgi:hypothetical protein